MRARFPTNVPFISPKSLACALLYGCATDGARVDVDEIVEEMEGWGVWPDLWPWSMPNIAVPIASTPSSTSREAFGVAY